MRSEDRNNVHEMALMGNARSFYPISSMSTASNAKISESKLLNTGYSATVGSKEYYEHPPVPYVKTLFDNRIVFSGTVQYIDPYTNENQSAIKKTIDKSWEILLLILTLPLVLLYKLYTIIEFCIRKVFKRTKPKVKTTEDKLYDLMEQHLNCIRM